LAAGIADRVRRLAPRPNVHVKLRLIFPGEDISRVLDRIAYFGHDVLPGIRKSLGK
jgi:hypothetical protein